MTTNVASTVSKLKEIQRMVTKCEQLEAQLADYKKERERLHSIPDQEAQNIRFLPTGTFDQLSRQFQNDIISQCNRKQRTIRYIISAFVLLCGLCCIGLAIFGKAQLVTKALSVSDTVDKIRPLAIVFSLGYTAAMVVYSRVEKCTPFDSFGDWISIGGFFFFAICIWGPIPAALTVTIFLLLVFPVLAVLPLLMFIGMILGRVNVAGKFTRPRDLQDNELARLEEAKKQDEANRKANQSRRKRAQKEAELRIDPQIQSIDQKISQTYDAIYALEQDIKNNGVLAPDDICGIDKIIGYLVQGRADSLKEALLRYDVEMRERARDAENRLHAQWEQIRRQQDAQQQMQRDAATARQNAEIARQNKRIADELEELRKDNDYYRRYGQPRP